MTPNHIMPESEKQQRLSKVHSLIQSKTFSGDKLVYSFVLDLRRNDEIDEYIDFVKHLAKKRFCDIMRHRKTNCGKESEILDNTNNFSGKAHFFNGRPSCEYRYR